MPPLKKTHYTKPRSCKIPDRYVLKLTTEAQKNGIGKPAVLLRSLLNEVLQWSLSAHRSISDLYEQSGVSLGRPYGDTPESTTTVTIRFDSETNAQIQKLLDKHSYNFATLVIGMLEGRYGSEATKQEEQDTGVGPLLTILEKTVSTLGECKKAHAKGLPLPDTDAVCNEAERVISRYPKNTTKLLAE